MKRSHRLLASYLDQSIKLAASSSSLDPRFANFIGSIVIFCHRGLFHILALPYPQIYPELIIIRSVYLTPLYGTASQVG